MESLFESEFEQQAIDRILRFARLADRMGFVPVLGFSGGKDSQVCYHLCKRSGIKFLAVFNHCFESAITLNFIREYYPEVIWRREVKEGFFDNITKNHNGLLPTIEMAYCCADYKHNKQFVDSAAIIGVRKQESSKRALRTVLSSKSKSLKRNSNLFSEYFKTSCISSGAPSEILLNPIVDWSCSEVWRYIYKYNIPVNPEYKNRNRVGCVICPKANMISNYYALFQFPKLIDAAIKARLNANNPNIDWFIKSDNKDYSDNKAEYICRWLNHSFRPFTKRQRILVDKVLAKYKELHNGCTDEDLEQSEKDLNHDLDNFIWELEHK